MAYWKYMNYIIGFAFICVFLFMVFRSFKNGRLEKEIISDPVYVDATITAVVPGTPTTNGLVNLTIDYFFKDTDGTIFKKEKVLTAIKTMDLYNYGVGSTVPVIYFRTNPSKNILKETQGILDK